MCKELFGEKNCYYTMKGTFELPEDWKEMSVALQVYSSLSEWDNTTNPQMKVSLNGNYIQAIDVNHREVRFGSLGANRNNSLTDRYFFGTRRRRSFRFT